jgi:nitrite reductase/ring-hydroxylating ferredoxin subunit
MSSEVETGQVIGTEFLGGRIVIYRGEGGVVQVLSAYCPHVGADLAVGDVVGDRLRCAFHHWYFDREGYCVETGIGDPPPPTACLFKFPTVERWGLIFAFNGTTATWDLPDFEPVYGGAPFRDEDLLVRVEAAPILAVDPWVLCANTPDMQHIRELHGISFEGGEPYEEVRWSSVGFMYDFKGKHWDDKTVENTVGIFGTSFFYQSTLFEGQWFGGLAPMGLLRPGASNVYLVIATHKGDGSPEALEEAEKLNDFAMDLEKKVVAQDAPIMASIRYAPGTFTKSDRVLARYLDFVRDYPRAHPSAPFIR